MVSSNSPAWRWNEGLSAEPPRRHPHRRLSCLRVLDRPTVAARLPSAVPRSPSRPPPTSSACGPCRSSRLRPLRHGTRVRPFRRDLPGGTEKGYSIIAGNTVHNEIWDRVHTLAGGLAEAAGRYDQVPYLARTLGVEISTSWVELAQGAPRTALEQAQHAVERHESPGNLKFAWRPPRRRRGASRAWAEARGGGGVALALTGNDLQDIAP